MKLLFYLLLFLATSANAFASEAPLSPLKSFVAGHGFDEQQVERQLVALFKSSFEAHGTEGLTYVTVLAALKADFGYAINVSDVERRIPDKDRHFYGLRAIQPGGLKALPEGANDAFRQLDRLGRGPFVGGYADAFASVCIPGELAVNERLVHRITNAHGPKESGYRWLSWSVRLRDAGCITAATFARVSAVFSKQAIAVLYDLDPANQILAHFALLKAGYSPGLTPGFIHMILGQPTENSEWGDVKGDILGRRDVMAAAAYLLTFTLVPVAPPAPPEAVGRLIDTMRIHNVIPKGGVFDSVTSHMRGFNKPEVANESLVDLKSFAFVKIIDDVKKGLGPVYSSCGCGDPKLKGSEK